MLHPSISPSSPHDRFAALDTMRGIAVAVVVIAHTMQLFYGFELPLLHGMGRFGVVLFFLVSGFVIPASFARHRSQRTFWIRRLCRLFPAYWTTVGFTAVVSWLHWFPSSPFYGPRSVETYVINLTMVPNFLNYSSMLSIFWSLHIEVLFYLFVGAIALLGIHRKTSFIGLLLVTVLLVCVTMPGLGISPWYPLYLMIIWCGTALQRVHQERESPLSAALFLFATLAFVWLAEGWSNRGFYHWGATLTAFLGILIVLRHGSWFQHPLLMWLGRISYSLYLVHLLVLAVVPPVGPQIIRVMVWIGSMLIVAAMTERWIERPSLALGRHLTAPREQRMVVMLENTVANT